jgi:hypothetical protein
MAPKQEKGTKYIIDFQLQKNKMVYDGVLNIFDSVTRKLKAY